MDCASLTRGNVNGSHSPGNTTPETRLPGCRRRQRRTGLPCYSLFFLLSSQKQAISLLLERSPVNIVSNSVAVSAWLAFGSPLGASTVSKRAALISMSSSVTRKAGDSAARRNRGRREAIATIAPLLMPSFYQPPSARSSDLCGGDDRSASIDPAAGLGRLIAVSVHCARRPSRFQSALRGVERTDTCAR